MKKVFAIGFKNWVEIRVSEKAPLAETDEVIKRVKEKKMVYIDHTNNYRVDEIEVPWKISTTHFEGGRVLYTLRSSRLKYLGVYVGDQKCVELNKEHINKLVVNGFPKLRKYLN